MEKIVFNSSLPRSGSELLQVILHQNPRIYGSSTSPLLEYQFGARQNYNLPEVQSQNSELMKDAFIAVCKGIADSYYSTVTDKPVVIDKNRGWAHYWEWVDQWNSEPKMICMIRDLRSIVASLERIYRANRHNPQGIDNPQKIENMTVEQRAQFWLNTQPLGLALQRTLDIFQRKLDGKILFIKYEDLCSQPDEVMKRVYEYIGEDYFKHDFDNIVKDVEEDDRFFGIFGKHNIKPKLVKTKEYDWQDVLNPPIADAIKESNQWFYKIFNY